MTAPDAAPDAAPATPVPAAPAESGAEPGAKHGPDRRAEPRPEPPGGPLRRLGRTLGPGVVAGAADDDPSGIATYSVAGAQFGTGLLWTAVFTWPLMGVVQNMRRRRWRRRRR